MIFFWDLRDTYQTFLRGFIVDPDGPRKEEEAFKLHKVLMREHEGK